MPSYPVQPTDWVFVIGYRLLYKNLSKKIAKNTIEILRSKYSQQFLDHAKQPATASLRILHKYKYKKNLKYLVIWFVTTDKITNVSKRLAHNSSGTVEIETENTGFNKKLRKKIFL